MQNELIDKRKYASDVSLGKSHEIIYQRALGLLKMNGSGQASQTKILDFGAGSGQFSNLLLQQGWSVSAVDLMAKPTSLATSLVWQSQDLNEKVNFENNSFDMIAALEIIEHLENPRFLAREWFRILKKGGTVLLSTPNNNSIRSILSYLVRGHFVDFTDKSYPAHITALNCIDLKRVLTEAGFSDIQVNYSNFGNIPFFTRLSWQNVSFNFFKGNLFSDNIFISAKKN